MNPQTRRLVGQTSAPHGWRAVLRIGDEIADYPVAYWCLFVAETPDQTTPSPHYEGLETIGMVLHPTAGFILALECPGDLLGYAIPGEGLKRFSQMKPRKTDGKKALRQPTWLNEDHPKE